MSDNDISTTFGCLLPDKCIVDSERCEIFNCIGNYRSLFAEMWQWQRLDEALLEGSNKLRTEVSPDEWKHDTGDKYDETGRPYCKMRSNLAKRVVTELAQRDGGLLWCDKGGEAWAIRLFPARNGKDWIGLSISLPGHGQQDRAKEGSNAELRLSARAGQFLWLLHSQVLQQRSSQVRIPDVVFAQVVWGGNQSVRPKDWRREIKQTLRSLTRLRFEILRIPANGWEPRLGSISQAIISIDDLTELGRITGERDACNAGCKLYGSGISHGHFSIHVGPKFLGALELLKTDTVDQGVRLYDFTPRHMKATEEFKEHQSSGGTPSVHLPAVIFGPTKWSGISTLERNVLNGVFGETTRASRSNRVDRAAIVRKALVPRVSGKEKTTCPVLDPKQEYVAFGGNGKRRGQGYRIIGENCTGWLHKCGFDVDADLRGITKMCRDFLGGLHRLCELFGFQVVAIDPRTTQWHELEEMKAILSRDCGWEVLDPLHLRIYAPADYSERLRKHFERHGRFEQIPGQLGVAATDSTVEIDLGARIQLVGLRQQDVADKIGVTQAFISQLLNGRKTWPEGLLEEVESIVKKEESTAGQEVISVAMGTRRITKYSRWEGHV